MKSSRAVKIMTQFVFTRPQHLHGTSDLPCDSGRLHHEVGIEATSKASTGPDLMYETVAYVSEAPKTFPEALSVSIRNQTTGGPSRSVEVIDGGFDPVGASYSGVGSFAVGLFILPLTTDRP